MILVTGYYWIIRLSISSVGVTGNVSIYSLISCRKGKRLNSFVHNMSKKMWSKTSSTVGNKNVMLTINSVKLKQLYNKMEFYLQILIVVNEFGFCFPSKVLNVDECFVNLKIFHQIMLVITFFKTTVNKLHQPQIYYVINKTH